jgi:hypothetical protein
MSLSDEEQCIPTSDPFEEVLLPSYSQREETQEEVESLMLDQHKHSQAKQICCMLIKADEKRRKMYVHSVLCIYMLLILAFSPTHSGKSQISRPYPSKKCSPAHTRMNITARRPCHLIAYTLTFNTL